MCVFYVNTFFFFVWEEGMGGVRLHMMWRVIQLGEYKSAIDSLNQAAEFYKESAEIEFRLAGIFFKLNDAHKAQYHLKNAYKIDAEYDFIIPELFPHMAHQSMVTEFIEKYKGSST